MLSDKTNNAMIGTKAPEFSLHGSTGQVVTLSDLSGTYIVLVFYPSNDTPVCDRQLSDLSINAADLLAINTRIFGVNTADENKHREYCTRRQLEFPILSDPRGVTAKKYKAFWGWIGVNRRTVVIIDPRGEICFYSRGNPSSEEIIGRIKSHQASVQPV